MNEVHELKLNTKDLIRLNTYKMGNNNWLEMYSYDSYEGRACHILLTLNDIDMLSEKLVELRKEMV